MHVTDGAEKGHKQDRDYTTQNKSNLHVLQEEYPTSVALYHEVCGIDVQGYSSYARLVFIIVV